MIIPVLGDHHLLPETIASALDETPSGGGWVEVIVVDGGDRPSEEEVSNIGVPDCAVEGECEGMTGSTSPGNDQGEGESVLDAFGVTYIKSRPGRGTQMDLGAREAKGEVLLFLHADTHLPEGWFQALEESLNDSAILGGGFCLSTDYVAGGFLSLGFRLIEGLIRIRSKLFGLIYGDQAQFIRRTIFEELGGFKGMPIMEDIDIFRRLKQKGRVVLLDRAVITSARRWIRKGVFVTTLTNQLYLVLYYLGVSPDKLYEWYYGKAEG